MRTRTSVWSPLSASRRTAASMLSRHRPPRLLTTPAVVKRPRACPWPSTTTSRRMPRLRIRATARGSIVPARTRITGEDMTSSRLVA